MLSRVRHPLILPAVQAALAVAVLGIAAAMPPERGALLIVSLQGESQAAIARWAVDGDTRILGRGPLPASLAVHGDSDALAARARAHGALLIAGAPPACGDAA